MLSAEHVNVDLRNQHLHVMTYYLFEQ